MKKLFLILLLLSACDCPNVSDVPQETVPVHYALVRYFNCLYDHGDINIDYNYYSARKEFTYDDVTTDYIKSPAGESTIYIAELPDTNIIISSSTRLDSNHYYDILLFGSKSSPRIALVDAEEKLYQNQAAVAFFNAGVIGENSAITITMKNSENTYEETLDYSGSRAYENFAPDTYDITVHSELLGEDIASLESVALEEGKYYIVLLRGEYGNAERGLELVVR